MRLYVDCRYMRYKPLRRRRKGYENYIRSTVPSKPASHIVHYRSNPLSKPKNHPAKAQSVYTRHPSHSKFSVVVRQRAQFFTIFVVVSFYVLPRAHKLLTLGIKYS